MDSFTEYSSRSLGDNIGRSLKGMLGGLALVVIAFPVLWKNEGRTDLSTVAKTATIIKADGSSSPASGKLVAVTDTLKTDAPIGDAPYIRSGSYVKLERTPEMYAWVEKVTTKSEKKLGGGTREAKTYSYERQWTTSAKTGEDFKVPTGHRNPEATVERETRHADVALIGVYGVDPSDAQMPSAEPLKLTAEVLVPKVGTVSENALYVRGAAPAAPRLGDERITWRDVATGGQVTAYGTALGHMLQPFLYKGEDRIFRVLPGTHEQAVAQMHGEHVLVTWVLRLVGFLCLWFGMTMLIGPVNAVLDIVPFIGSAGRLLTGLVLFPVAFGITLVVVFVSIVAHDPFVMIPVIAAIAGGGYFLFKRAARKKVARTGTL